jgi:hypothetical protein
MQIKKKKSVAGGREQATTCISTLAKKKYPAAAGRQHVSGSGQGWE